MILPSVRSWITSTLDCHNYALAIDELIEKLKAIYNAETFSIRLTCLEDLVLKCDEVSSSIEESDPYFLKEVMQLQAQALYFIKAIFNVQTNKEMIDKLVEQRKLKEKFPTRVVMQNFNYAIPKETLLNNRFLQLDKEMGVKYLDEKEREWHRVILVDGKFYQIKLNAEIDNILDVTLELKPFDSSALVGIFICEFRSAIITMDHAGNMFVGKTSLFNFQHSSTVSGEDCFFAGLIATNKNGELTYLSNPSGHYEPKEENTANFIKYLSERGAISSKVKIGIVSRRDIPATLQQLFISHNIDISEIQHDLKSQLFSSLQLMSYKVWRNQTNAGFFNIRNKSLKKIDQLLAQYLQSYNRLSPQENIQIIDNIMSHLKFYKEQNSLNENDSTSEKTPLMQSSTIKLTISSLEKQLAKEKIHWQDSATKLKSRKYDYTNLSYN